MSDYDPTSLEGVPEAGRARLQQNRRGLFTSGVVASLLSNRLNAAGHPF